MNLFGCRAIDYFAHLSSLAYGDAGRMMKQFPGHNSNETLTEPQVISSIRSIVLTAETIRIKPSACFYMLDQRATD